MIRDLREFSADLLAVGLTDRSGLRRNAGTAPGSMGRLLAAVTTMTRLIPILLVELREIRARTGLVEVLVPTPVRAEVSKRPADYQRVGKRMLPMRWVSLAPAVEGIHPALRWLHHLLLQLKGQIDEARDRTKKRVSDALAARASSSGWGLTDRYGLERMIESLSSAEASLVRQINRIRASAPGRLLPSERPPSPFPMTPAWAALRRMADALFNPETSLPDRIVDVLTGTETSADLPFLYQRWVGVRIVGTLEGMGWITRDDPVGAIFLGGRMTFEKGAARFDLWVEPRLSKEPHECGFQTRDDQDATPDYMFIIPGPGGFDALILDATLNTDYAAILKKGNYINRLEREGLAMFAGCPVVKRPLAAWSACPSAARQNRMLVRDGTIGSIPMLPQEYDGRPLHHWLEEIGRRTLAWTPLPPSP